MPTDEFPSVDPLITGLVTEADVLNTACVNKRGGDCGIACDDQGKRLAELTDQHKLQSD